MNVNNNNNNNNTGGADRQRSNVRMHGVGLHTWVVRVVVHTTQSIPDRYHRPGTVSPRAHGSTAIDLQLTTEFQGEGARVRP